MTLVYLAVAWAAGIWLARAAWAAGWLGCAAPPVWLWGLLLVLPAAILWVQWRGQRPYRPRLAVACLLFLLLGAGRYHLSPFTPCWNAGNLAFYNGSLQAPTWATVTGIVQRPPETRDTRLRIRVEAESLATGKQAAHPAHGAALFTVDRTVAVRTGDRIRVHGRLEAPPVLTGFDYRAYLAQRGVHSMVQQPEVTVLQHDAGSWFWRSLYRLSAAGQTAIARLLPEPEAGLLTGILLGVETGIAPDLYDRFNRTGTSHIIVISGFNITIIAAIMTAAFGRLLGKRRAFWPVVLGIALYVLLVGADAAVLRAGLMGVLVVWASYLNRRSTAAVSLFAAGLAMTVFNPLTLWDVGFQLSFMATLSLILFATPMTRRFEATAQRRLPAGLARGLVPLLNDALIVTLAATVLTLPLIVYYFGRMSLVSPLTNLLVLPVQPPVMIWGGLATITGAAAQALPALEPALWPLARGLALVPWLCLHWTVLVVNALAALPFASLDARLGLAGLWGYFGLIGYLMLGERAQPGVLRRVRQALRRQLVASRLSTASAGVLLAAAGVTFFALQSQPDGRLHVHFLGLTRGEAVLIVTPDGQQVLVDGGASPTELLHALSQHMPFYDRTLELVVTTGASEERVGALADVAERYRVAQVLQAPFPYPSTAYERWLRSLRDHDIPVAPAERGSRVLLGYGVSLDVLHPGPEPALDKAGELQEEANALALRLNWGETSFLLLGNLDAATVDALVEDGSLAPADVVTLPQGGRSAGFSANLLSAARPQHAVVFVEPDDRFRRLAGSVQDAWLAQVGPAGWHRTDLAGTVSFSTDGYAVQVEGE